MFPTHHAGGTRRRSRSVAHLGGLSRDDVDLLQDVARMTQSWSRRRHHPLDSDEVGQIALVGAWQAMHRFDGRGSLWHWCYQRARGAVIDALRQCLDTDVLDDEVSVTDARCDVEASVMASQDIERVMRALSPVEQNVARRRARGDTLAEIALATRRSEGRICQIQRKIRTVGLPLLEAS